MANANPQHDWIGHVQPIGLVVSTLILDELGAYPLPQSAQETAEVESLLSPDGPALSDAWAFFNQILGWRADKVAGSPGGPAIPETLRFNLRDHETLLEPTMAVVSPGGNGWQLLVRVEAPGVELEKRGALKGWEATPHQRFERLLRETGVGAGLLINDTTIRLITAPKGETSGWINWPIRPLASVGGRPMLGGFKLLLDNSALFTNAAPARLPAMLAASRDRQAEVSTKLAGQVLAALHELLRGFDAAEPALIRDLAANRPQHLYEGLLAVLMRLVFILYAEDRDLMPSRADQGGRALYEQGYAVRGLFAKLEEDAALHPDTMDDRRGGWGRLLALFRLVDRGHASGFMQARRGKLFDEARFPFLMGKADAADEERVPYVSDGCIHRVLHSLMMVNGERLSYRTLDVEQIGSVYETVMGFTVELAAGCALAIKAGKNNKVPVFVDLDALAVAKPTERIKILKEQTGRGNFPTAATKGLKDAVSVGALEAALGTIADLRGSPRGQAFAAGTPILQPTDERRRTGSHYTPRALTGPIVFHALEPAFARLGADATPDAVLALKICDPACGSGAFLVEACRQVGARLTLAWEAHPALKPPIPPDEDEDLHARRLVAQRCLYGVDKNPMAVDLAKLSLWLATLARDHEFSFLDHALKSGDSLVGLTRKQLSAGNWDTSAVYQTLLGQQIADRVANVALHRDAIRSAADDVTLAMQEARHGQAERELARVRLIGDAIIAAFFKHDKPKARIEEARYLATMAGGSDWWESLAKRAVALEGGEHPIHPFHWEIEFPEVFSRDNPGFDAIVGNPPFAGKNTTIAGNAAHFLDWLQTLHAGAHGNADLVAHFFRRAFGLVRSGGAFGLIATNTIGQGDTRETGLAAIIAQGGAIAHATKRLKWPGEAAVVVSVVHVVKGQAAAPTLDGRAVSRVSAYLVEGELDGSPHTLHENAGKAFQGSILLGMGFTFDDIAAEKGKASTLSEMESLIAKNSRNAEIIKPFLGWAEVSNSPVHAHHRFAIDFSDRPLERKETGENWAQLNEEVRRQQLRDGVVATDYPNSVARDWPDLIEIVQRMVKPERDPQSRDALRKRWWQYGEKRPGLYGELAHLDRSIVTSSQAAAHLTFAFLPTSLIYSSNLNVFTMDGFGDFCSLCSRAHEVWALAFGSTMKDDPTYTIDTCFKTFPFPEGYAGAPALEAAGGAYHAHRAALMIATDKGMTKTYNRFHDPHDKAADIVELRRLHAAMDDAVLRAYGWDDLATRAAGEDTPRFLTEDDEDDHKYQKRLFWPAPFRDELLARLLKLNEERAAAERGEGD